MALRRRERAFTLIELLVVITILGLLVGCAAPRVFEALDDGRVARARSDLHAFRSALGVYWMDRNRYPTTTEGLVALTEGTPKHPHGLIENFPEADPWGNPYEYTSDGENFEVVCLGSDGRPGGEGYAEDLVVSSEPSK